MLLNRHESCLLLVDVQRKLTPLICNSEKIITRCSWLMNIANDLGIPCLISEQYPRGLGETLPELLAIPHSARLEKVHFSCGKDNGMVQYLRNLGKRQVLIQGIETHVCVLQTAFDLVGQDFQVYVVTDAVGSRAQEDYHAALARMSAAGISLITAEMALFEWLEQAATPEFRALSMKYLK